MPNSAVTKLKVDMAELKQKVNDLCENFVEFKDQYGKDIQELKLMIDRTDSRYAAKWAENAWIWLITAIGILAIGYAVRIILSHGLGDA